MLAQTQKCGWHGSIVVAVLVFLLLQAKCSQAFSLKQRLPIIHGSVTQLSECGYDISPILVLTNSTLMYWSYQNLNSTYLPHIRCFKYAQKLQEQKRYLLLFYIGLQFGKYEHFMFRIRGNKLQHVDWNPLPIDHVISNIKISPNTIVIAHHSNDTATETITQVSVFNTWTLEQIKEIKYNTTNATIILEVDYYDNVLVYKNASQQLQILYGESYRLFQLFKLNVEQYELKSIKNIGMYTPDTIDQNFVVYYDKIGGGLGSKRYISITQTQKQTQVQASVNVEVWIDPPILFQRQITQINCGDQLYYFSGGEGCVKYQAECIINRVPVHGYCLRETNNEVHQNHNKLILVFKQESLGNGEMVQIWIQNKQSKIIFIIILAICLAVVVLAVLIYVLKVKGVILKPTNDARYRTMDEKEMGFEA